jgi:hypothetical protein
MQGILMVSYEGFLRDLKVHIRMALAVPRIPGD